MSWLDRLLGNGGGSDPAAQAAASARQAEWEKSLTSGGLPSFVEARLNAAASGTTPWISTMTPAELAMARHHGIRPVATVTGTCFFHYGYSWTLGHAQGWHEALARLREEAYAAGANAVVDVKMRTLHLGLEACMDFTVVGTAVRIDGLPRSDEPVVATVPALEFVRLLTFGIVPVGIAIGANYQVLSASPYAAGLTGGGFLSARSNQPLTDLGDFWHDVRRGALRDLKRDGHSQGNGVLAHTHFGQLIKLETERDQPQQFLGRHIVIGTVIHTRRSAANLPIEVSAVVDMRDGESPLGSAQPHGHNAYPLGERDGPI